MPISKEELRAAGERMKELIWEYLEQEDIEAYELRDRMNAVLDGIDKLEEK